MTKKHHKHTTSPEDNRPDHKGYDEPQPEATHGGDTSDFGKKEHDHSVGQDKIADNLQDEIAKDQQNHDEERREVSELNEERLRTEGSLGGEQREQSLYQGGQGKKLPVPDELEDKDEER